MKRPPPGSTFLKQQMDKKLFLNGVKDRLQNDVGNYFDWITAHSKRTNVVVGFWGSLRMIMPVVEAVCDVLKINKFEFMNTQLGMKAPSLVWDMFRHSLIHNDHLQSACFESNKISWSVSIGSEKHIFHKNVISVDASKLYFDLIDFLDCEISKDENLSCSVDVGIKYHKPKPEIKKELEGLGVC